jgi:hypothetical protein
MLKILVAAFVIAAGADVAAQPGAIVRRDFEQDATGRPPAGFVFAESRDAAPKRWSVQRDGAIQALVHSGDSAAGRGFAAAVLAAPELREVALSVKIRFGSRERSGGLVWRYRDPDNYYFVELNLGEHAIRLYRMVNGNRVRLEGEDDLELDPSAWHSLKVVQRDRSVRVYLSGIRVFEERDRTLAAAGMVGVWCAGNSAAQFDDLSVERVGD